jgi:hypothetical protein
MYSASSVALIVPSEFVSREVMISDKDVADDDMLEDVAFADNAEAPEDGKRKTEKQDNTYLSMFRTPSAESKKFSAVLTFMIGGSMWIASLVIAA